MPGLFGGGQKEQTSTTQVQLPSWLDNAAQDVVSRAQLLSKQPYVANPNEQVAPLNADQQATFQAIRDYQGSQTGTYDAAKAAATGLLGSAVPLTAGQIGGMATELMNPYNAAVTDVATRKIQDQGALAKQQIAQQAGNVGAFGGSRQGVLEGTQEAQTARQIGDAAATYQQQGWQQALSTAQGIGNANLNAGLTAMGLLPQIATAAGTQGAREIGLLGAAGTVQQQQAQAEDDATNRAWMEERDYPTTQLGLLMSAVGGVPYGSTTRTTQPVQGKNPLTSAIGGAAAGAQIGSMFPGWGTAIGAGAGALLGAFG